MRSRTVALRRFIAASSLIVLGIASGARASTPVSAHDLICKFSHSSYEIVFSNGVDVRYDAAVKSATESARVLSAAEIESPAVTSRLAAVEIGDSHVLHHAPNGFTQDISETILQKARAETGQVDLTWERMVDLVGKYTPDPLGLGEPITRAFAAIAMERIKEAALRQVDEEAAADYQKVRNLLRVNPGQRLLVIGHSQGSLYANGVFDGAVKNAGAEGWSIDYVRERVRVVNVGAAAADVAGFSRDLVVDARFAPRYVTSAHDTVINQLRSLSNALSVAPSLRANAASKFTALPSWASVFENSDRLTNHGYVSTYLYDTSSTGITLQRVLRETLRERVDVTPSPAETRIIQLELDVETDGTTYMSPDSTWLNPAGPILDGLTAPAPLYRPFLYLYGPAGAQTISATMVPVCDFGPTLNLRRDYPSDDFKDADWRAQGNEVLSQPFGVTLVYRPGAAVLVRAARVRLAHAGLPVTEWTPLTIDSAVVTRATYGADLLNVDLARYSLKLEPTGLVLTLQ